MHAAHPFVQIHKVQHIIKSEVIAFHGLSRIAMISKFSLYKRPLAYICSEQYLFHFVALRRAFCMFW